MSSSQGGGPRRITAVALLAFALIGCEQKELVSIPRTSVNHTLFVSYVALGNSLTAGFQSAGIVDSTQAESYAAIIAHQAGTRYAYAALTYPGCPPPIVNFLTGATLGGAGAPICSLRDPSSVTATLNNVAVPGAASNDPTAATTGNSNALTTFILGGESQVQRALDANPTFVSIWIGNNDALEPALTGFASGVPTPVDTFTTRYDAMMQQLTSGAKGLKGLLIGVVDVTASAALFPVDSLINDPVLKAEFNAAVTGNPNNNVPINADCNGAHALISIEFVAAVHAGQIPAAVGCSDLDPFTLDLNKQAAVTGSVQAYNAHIQTAASSAGFAYFDPNPLLAALKAVGAVPTVPNLTSATAPFGAFISLDGIHPTALAHQYLANAMIKAINQKYAVAIDTVAHQ